MIKSEARNPKSETTSKLECSNARNEKIASFGHFNFGNSDFLAL